MSSVIASKHRPSSLMSIVAALALAGSIAVSTPASAQLPPRWDRNPISDGLGPTYGET